MTRTRVVVLDPNGHVIHIEDKVIEADLGVEGALKITTENTSVVFAPGFWSKVTTELITD